MIAVAPWHYCVVIVLLPRTGSALALLYGTQNTMEQHHFNHAVMILNSEVRLKGRRRNEILVGIIVEGIKRTV